MNAMARPAIRDFGFDADEAPYHFSVVLQIGENAPVRFEEHYSFPPKRTSGGRRVETKAVLDGYRWSRIEGAAKADFNQRLVGLGYKPATWHTRETLLAPHFGKELVLLAWAVEDADPTVIPNVIANWKGLAPEERWWLYTTVNATSGHPEHGRDRGWRKAIKIALAENPAHTSTPGTIWLRPGDSATTPPSRARSPKHRGSAKQNPDQLTLVDDSQR